MLRHCRGHRSVLCRAVETLCFPGSGCLAVCPWVTVMSAFIRHGWRNWPRGDDLHTGTTYSRPAVTGGMTGRGKHDLVSHLRMCCWLISQKNNNNNNAITHNRVPTEAELNCWWKRPRYSTILCSCESFNCINLIYNISSCKSLRYMILRTYSLILAFLFPITYLLYLLGHTAQGNMMTPFFPSHPPEVTDASLVISSVHVGGQLIHLSAAVR